MIKKLLSSIIILNGAIIAMNGWEHSSALIIILGMMIAIEGGIMTFLEK